MSGKPDADTKNIASVSDWPMDRLAHFHTGGKGNHRATGRPPDTAGSTPRQQTQLETAGELKETAGVASPHTTASGLLKQPDKHKTFRRIFLSRLPTQSSWLTWLFDLFQPDIGVL
jgi:hypothetical protein